MLLIQITTKFFPYIADKFEVQFNNINKMSSCTGITCSICEEVYNLEDRPPLLLPCSHTFCRNCIQQMKLKSNGLCPVCRKSFKGQPIDKLPLIRQLADPLMNIKTKKFKSAHDERTCTAHKAEFVLWCTNCKESICSHCLLEKHKACDWIHVTEKTTELMKNLHGSAAKTGKKLLENFTYKASENDSKLTDIRNCKKNLQHYENIVMSFGNELHKTHAAAMDQLEEYKKIPQDSSVSMIMSTMSKISSLLDDPTIVPIIPKFLVPECDDPANSSDVAEPTGSADVAEPADHSNVAEPVGSANAAEPAHISNVAEPVGSVDVAEPANISDVAESANSPDMAWSADDTDTSDSDYEIPLEEPLSGSLAGPSTSMHTVLQSAPQLII